MAAAGAIILTVVAASADVAAAPTKEQCVASHGAGQDLRARGQLAQARQEFLSCAQASCPSLVQSDCARYGEDLGRMVPTVTFVARDSSGGDVSDTQVFVDDKLVAQRLEGHTYELDPGKHLVKWVHQGKEATESVVVNQGEQGREIIATFAAPPRATTGDGSAAANTSPASGSERPSRSASGLVLAGWVASSVLGAGAVASAIVAKSEASSLATARAQLRADQATIHSKATATLTSSILADSLGGTAVLLSAVTLYFELTTPSSTSSTSARLGLSTGRMLLEGSF